jgi:hypothetical protein
MPRLTRFGSGVQVSVFLVATAVCAFGFYQVSPTIWESECAVPCHRLPSTIALELSFSAQTFRTILLAWSDANPTAPGRFKWVVGTLGSLFPPLFAALLSSLYAWLGARLTVPVRPLVVKAPWLAMAFAYAENALILILLGGVSSAAEIPQSFPAGLVALLSVVSAVKWTSVGVAVIGIALLVANSPLGPMLWICRFGFLSVALGSLPILLLPQGSDVLRSLVEAESGAGLRVAAFGLLFTWAASVWYWSRVLLMSRMGPPGTTGLGRFVPRGLGALTLALPGLAFGLAAKTAGSLHNLLIYYCVLCLALALVFLALVAVRRRYLEARARAKGFVGPPTGPFSSWNDLPLGSKRVAILSLLVSGLFFLALTIAPVSLGQGLGSLSIVMLAAANAVFFGSGTVFFGQAWRLPFVTCALLLAAAFSFWNDNHALRLAYGPRPKRPMLQDAFAKWLLAREVESDRQDEGASIPVFLVAAEGGGVRAAYWTAAALARIQDREPSFARHVFAISSVSGGSLGAAVFSALAAQDASGSMAECPPDRSDDPILAGLGQWQRCAHLALAPNFLGPTLAKMLAPDLAQWFVPFPVPQFDRAWALEDGWADAFQRATHDDRLSRPFLDLWKTHGTEVPALVLNGTHVEWGRRVLLSPFEWGPGQLIDAYDAHQVLGADLPLKTAVHMSARFAYVSPAGWLRSADGADHGHVVDGGYFENSGTETLQNLRSALARVLESDPRLRGGSPLAARVHFFLLYLCNDPLFCGRAPVDPGCVEAPPEMALTDLFAPLRALAAARQARASLALDAITRNRSLSGFDEVFEIGVCPKLAAAEKKAPLPLGWQLSQEVRDLMIRQLSTCGEDSEEDTGKPCPATCVHALDNDRTMKSVQELLRTK